MHASFRAFLDALDAAGELRRISEPVDPRLEIAAIADRHSKRPCPRPSAAAASFDPLHAGQGGHALLFENVKGCDFPLAINIFGSYRRMEMALGCEDGGFAAIGDRIASLTKPQPPRNFGELLARGREFLPLLRTPPRNVRRAASQDVILRADRGEVDLTRLPIIKCWPHDGDPAAVDCQLSPEQAGTAAGEGRYITLAGMHTIHADDRDEARPASHNIGMYRSQLIDSTRLAMHWHVHHDGASHWRSWKRLGQRMPIAIVLGGESVLPYAATAPLPPGIGELLMAGFLNGRGIPLVPAATVPLRVPANAEIIIEGWVSTECGPIGWDPRGDEPLGPGAVFEGPFGDHTGFYSLPDRYPIVEVTAITHRQDAVYPTTIVGLPPQEDYYLGKATERIFFPLLKTLIHDIEDYHLARFGCFHNCAFVRINKAYPLQARRVMHAIWGAGQMAWTKMIVVVDDDVDVHDERAVLAAIADRCHLVRDVETVRGPLDILDHAAPRLGAGTKIGFDATRAWPGEEAAGIEVDGVELVPAAAPDARQRGADLVARAFDGAAGIETARFAEMGDDRFLFLGVAERADARAAISAAWAALDAADAGACGTLVIAIDAATTAGAAGDEGERADWRADWEGVFFTLAANADPGRDAVRDADPSRGRLGFDATRKQRGPGHGGDPVRDYPPIVAMDADVEANVQARASAFGLD
ncbi:MAG: UbiD family decarboxylase [Phycisphaerales bacterium]